MTANPDGCVLVAEGLGMRFRSPEGTITLFSDVDLNIRHGEAVAVLGASGSGKSTLLGLLAGLDQPSEGRVLLDGHDLSRLDEDDRAAVRAGRVGFVFQAFHLLPGMTALENVMLPGELAGSGGVRERAAAALERVGLAGRGSHYPAQLSGGEQQRVALARAFVDEPRVLFADEPTGNLDRHTGEHIIDAMFALNRDNGTTLVLVTHDPALAGRCGRIIHVEETGLREEVAA
ncbi:putative ABC transporter ATP-binding protein YknY [wastewater metagenome]|uniref:Putative ABC transporter ATP-binding protein YknY n=3 Tax=root TaxID=1 RepID=A0A5B8RBF0_9ZZZZ|nr:ATP-binding cassette domain-containing protein [Arhodomonas aquaeolei]MCS4505337.1 ATP-binding cassette domain-containing protein [Arhodomonas aquaeolei]QEA06026.1 putative ABC transporter ATP-binding protein YknY [uncultured organism]